MTDIEHQTESYNQVAERSRTAPSPHVANTPQTPDGLGKKNMAEELLVSVENLVIPVIGIEKDSLWMKAATTL